MTIMKVNVAEAKAHFSELISRALSGEEVIVARDNKPLVKLVPVASQAPRRPGGAKGQVLFMADDFDAPLPQFAEYWR
jgi:prevent-host-death family protein